MTHIKRKLLNVLGHQLAKVKKFHFWCLVSIWYEFLGFSNIGAEVCILLDVILVEHLHCCI